MLPAHLNDVPMLRSRCATCGEIGVYVVKGMNYCTEHVAAAAGWPTRKPTWQCEFCGKFYSERTAKKHAACLREEDRRRAEGTFG